jgi:DUF971 family protein
MTPDRIEVTDRGRRLTIRWPDGRSDEIGAALLRRACRSARVRRAAIDGAPEPAGDICITALEPVGHYAVNIAFSDGEARGIYPWPLLAELARCTNQEDGTDG